MTDTTQTPAQQQQLPTSWRIAFAIAALLFCGGVSVAIGFWGTPGNAFQATLLTGCIQTAWLVLVGVGIGSITDPAIKIIQMVFGKS